MDTISFIQTKIGYKIFYPNSRYQIETAYRQLFLSSKSKPKLNRNTSGLL